MNQPKATKLKVDVSHLTEMLRKSVSAQAAKQNFVSFVKAPEVTVSHTDIGSDTMDRHRYTKTRRIYGGRFRVSTELVRIRKCHPVWGMNSNSNGARRS